MNSLAKTLLVIGLAVLIVTVGLFFIGQRKDATLLTVHVAINSSTPTPIIDGVSAEITQVNRFNLPERTPLMQPGITVIVIKDRLPISDWVSTGFNGTGGVYELKVGLHQQIKPGDKIRIVARIISEEGEDTFAIATDLTV
jgi:hypothetical protein